MKKNILITGSSYEYMQNMCELLIELDNFIYLSHENWKYGMQLADDTLKSQNIRFIHVDNKDIRSVQMLHQKISDNSIDAIINIIDLSMLKCSNLSEISLWEWDNVINSPLKQMFILQKVFSEDMLTSEHSMINVIVRPNNEDGENIFSDYIIKGILSFSDAVINNELLNFRLNNIFTNKNLLYQKNGEIFNIINSFIKDTNINGAYLKV